ncbi:MAG: hypothetical protein ACI4PX_04230, partial [Ruminococcus sp.]
MKDILKKFKYRKMILALADAFIIGVSALISNFLLSVFNLDISGKMLTVSIVMSVVSCVICLLAFGAYSKLWRYFNKKDYLSCIYGIFFGMASSCLFFGLMTKTLPVPYAILHC